MEGIINYNINGDKEEAKRRINICLEKDGENEHCRNLNKDKVLGLRCSECGCILKYKIFSEKSKCPIGKWKK